MSAQRLPKRVSIGLGAVAALIGSASALAALVFTSQPPTSATVGQRYAYTMTAANVPAGDGGKPDGGVRFIARVLPVWLEFDGRDTLFGTPGPDDVGEQQVKLRAKVKGAEVDQDFTITVAPAPGGPPPPGADLAAAAAVSPNPVAVGAAATFTVTARNPSDRDVANAVLETVFTGDAPLAVDGVDDDSCAIAPRGGDTAVTCRWSPLASGASRSARVTARASGPGEIVAVARVSIADASPIDPNPDNDAARVVLSVTGTGSGKPSQELSAPGAVAVAVADFDGDGRDDLAVATGAGRPTLIFLGAGDAAHPFSPTPIAAGEDTSAGTAVAAADLDGDGAPDIAIANADAPSEVLFNDGSAGFERLALDGSAGGGRGVAIADVDGDSLPDVVLANDGPSAVYLNQGSRELVAETVDVRSSAAVLAADLIGDGRPELVFVHADRDADLYARGDGGYSASATLATGPAASAAAADFDADGHADLAFARGAADLVLLNGSADSPSFAEGASLGESDTVAVLAGDFDLDGRNDVVSIGASGAHRLYANDGASPPSFAARGGGFSGKAATGAAQGLFDAGGLPDVAVAGSDVVDVFLDIGGAGSGGAAGDAPVLTLNGASTMTLTVGDAYQDPGATATDAVDGDLTSKIVVDDPVDTRVIGRYSVTYEVVDSAGNLATATRTVEVVARAPAGGGGGGAAGPALLLLLSCGAFARALRR